MKTNFKKALMIVNSSSRNGCDETLQNCVHKIEQAGIELIEKKPESCGESIDLVERYKDEVDLVILGGGDGTISSMAATLYENRLPFAILPLGTANDLARSIGIPFDVEQACEIIAEGHTRPIDLGEINGEYFFNVAHIGLGIKITNELTPELKKTWGVFSYLKAFLSAFKRKRVFRSSIDVDGRQQTFKSIHLAIGNGMYYGGGNLIDENACIDNGKLSFYGLKPQSLWEFITLAPLLRDGQQRRAKRVITECGEQITIRTARPMEIHADGEPVSHTPAKFRVIHQALRICAPAGSNRDQIGDNDHQSSDDNDAESEAA